MKAGALKRTAHDFNVFLCEKMPFIAKILRRGKRKHKSPTSEDAINNLKEMEAMLEKKQLHFEEKIAKEIAEAKQYMKTNQRLALAAVRRKKMYEKNLEKIDSVLMKLDSQRTALENAGENTEVMKVLEQTTKALRVANKNLDVDKINEIMDQVYEGLQDSDELGEALSRPVRDDIPNEEELMNELLELEDAVAAHVPVLPPTPAGPITRSKSREGKDKDLNELEQWAVAN